jgi:hypothetical protein
MRTSHWIAALALGLEVGLAPAVEPPAIAPPVAAWVEQLGSRRFGERLAAIRALDALGATALQELRRAAASEDPEIRRQAKALVARIEWRIESARLTTPRYVRLSYTDTPFAAALADFSKKTGFVLKVEGDKDKTLADRKVSLKTGDLTAWEAFDRFCAAAGVVERSLLFPEAPPARPVDPNADLIFKITQIRGMEGPAGSGPADAPIVVMPGKPPLAPTCCSSAVRIRVRPGTPVRSLERSAGSEEVTCTLDTRAEPGVIWHGVVDVRIDSALADESRVLTYLPERTRAQAAGQRSPVEVWAVKGRLVMLPDKPSLRPLDEGEPNRVDLFFHVGQKPARTLQLLQGTLVGRVETPPQALLTVDQVRKAAGKSVKDDCGHTLQVISVADEKEGQFEVKLKLTAPLGEGNAVGGGQGFGGMRRNRSSLADFLEKVFVQDAKGQNLERLTTEVEEIDMDGQSLTTVATLYFRAKNGKPSAAKLVLMGRRPALVEVPFSLKNVPLP